MSIRAKVESHQPRARVIAVRIDGSDVSSSAASTDGVDEGAGQVTALKGTSGTANEVTLAWDPAFARTPVLVAMPITVCDIVIKSVSTSGAVIETFATTDGTTGVNDADFHLLIWGWDTDAQYE